MKGPNLWMSGLLSWIGTLDLPAMGQPLRKVGPDVYLMPPKWRPEDAILSARHDGGLVGTVAALTTNLILVKEPEQTADNRDS